MNETNNLIAIAREGQLDHFIAFDWLTGMNLLGEMFPLTFLSGYFMRRVEAITNKWLWIQIPIVAVLYGFLAAAPDAGARAYVRSGVLGAIAALLAALLVVLAHDKLLTALAVRI